MAQAPATAVTALYELARAHKRAEKANREAARAAMRAHAALLAELGIHVTFTAPSEAQNTNGTQIDR